MTARNALILGASGLIGSHLLRTGQKLGIPVAGTSFRQRLPGLRPVDITDSKQLTDVLHQTRPALIFLPAANPNVELCETDPAGTRKINVAPVRTVAEVAASLDTQVVYYSSDYIFDGRNGPYSESDHPNPICEYGHQKLESECLLREIIPHNHLILRVTVVYGWEHQGKNFVARLVRTVGAGQAINVPDDQVGSPTLADDIADASWALAEMQVSGTLHLAGPDLIDRYRFARKAAEVFELDLDLVRPVSTDQLHQAAARPLRAGMISQAAEVLLGKRLSGIATGLVRLKAQLASQIAGTGPGA